MCVCIRCAVDCCSEFHVCLDPKVVVSKHVYVSPKVLLSTHVCAVCRGVSVVGM